MIVLALVTAEVLHRGVVVHVDHDISRRMVDWNVDHRGFKPAVYALTLFGQRGTVLGVTLPVLAWVTWRSRSVEPFLRYVLALVLLTVAVYALKDATERSGPPVDRLHLAGAASFPSGHLANATLIWSVMWWCAVKTAAPVVVTRILAVIRVAGPICVVIGMTLLNYHWFSDFIAGLCVALVLLWIVLHPRWSPLADRLDARLLRYRAT